jgi:methionyl-tRNA formyltransferase
LLARIRGLSPAPAATTVLAGEVIKIFGAQAESGQPSKDPGRVLDNQLLINAGEGTALRLLSVQRPGRSRQEAGQFLQGFPPIEGTYAQKMMDGAR